jgi:hypothetical protein
MYSAAAYGPVGSGSLISSLRSIIFGGSERWFVSEYLGISQHDILFHYSDKHFIALDHSSRSIELSIRGTFNLNDVITCLLAHPIEFCEGIAQSGMVSAARELAKFAVPILRKAVQNYPRYESGVVWSQFGRWNCYFA